MAQSSPTTAAGSSPPSIEVDSALPAGSAALQSPFTIGEPVGRTIRSVRPLCVHRMANATVDEEMIAALFERMNRPPRHVDFTPRVHWSAKVALIAFAIASTLLVVTQ